jgi:hypothetical protein
MHRGTEAIHKIEKALLRLRAVGRLSLFRQFPVKPFSAESLSAPRTARAADDFLVSVVDGNGTGIGFHCEPASDKAMGDAVEIAIEPQAKIFVDQSLRRVPVIIRITGSGRTASARKRSMGLCRIS